MCKLLCIISVCVWLPVVFCGSRDRKVTTINFNSKFNFSDGSVVSECMADRSQYFVSENESLIIMLHHNAEDVHEIICDIPGFNVTYIDDITRPPYDLKYYVPSVYNMNVFANCLITLNLNVTGYVYSWCYAHIYADVKNISNPIIFEPTTKNIYVYLTVDPKNNFTMKDITYYKNSSLSIKCIEPDDKHYTHELIGKDNNGISRKLLDGNFHGLFQIMNESLNGMELVCVVTDKRTLNTSRAGVTLRYQNYLAGEAGISIVWILVFTFVVLALTTGAVIVIVRLYSKFKDKKRAQVQSTPATNNEPVENIYEFIYDNVYEDRVRMERAARQAQEKKESEEETPPIPPPISTIPMPVQQQTIKKPQRYSMLTPESDMYLLQIDSEGYQIPEEVQMRGIQLDINTNKRK